MRQLRLLGDDLRKAFLPTFYAGRIKPYPLADVVNTEVLRQYHDCPNPAFVLANYMDVHSPYLAIAPHVGIFAGAEHPPVALLETSMSDAEEQIALKRDRYDEALHQLDSQLQRLFEQLDADGALGDSWLFITADHGEAFVEHDTTAHGSSIYNEQVRIPLIVKPPRGVQLPPPDGPVSLLDVTATIAAIAGHPDFGVGRDLRQPSPAGHVVGIEFNPSFRTNAHEVGKTAGVAARAVVAGHFKLLQRDELYELTISTRIPTNSPIAKGSTRRSCARSRRSCRTCVCRRALRRAPHRRLGRSMSTTRRISERWAISARRHDAYFASSSSARFGARVSAADLRRRALRAASATRWSPTAAAMLRQGTVPRL